MSEELVGLVMLHSPFIGLSLNRLDRLPYEATWALLGSAGLVVGHLIAIACRHRRMSQEVLGLLAILRFASLGAGMVSIAVALLFARFVRGLVAEPVPAFLVVLVASLVQRLLALRRP